MPYKDSNAHKAAKKRFYLKNIQLTKDRALASKHRQQDWFKALKDEYVKGGCGICGYKGHRDDFDFHHTDPKTKISSVSDRVGTVGKKKILEEISKCVIICKSCHANIHKPNYPFH